MTSFGSSFRPTIEHFYDGLAVGEGRHDAGLRRVDVRGVHLRRLVEPNRLQGRPRQHHQLLLRQIQPGRRGRSGRPRHRPDRPISVFEYGSGSEGLRARARQRDPRRASPSPSRVPTRPTARTGLTFKARACTRPPTTTMPSTTRPRPARKYLDPDTSARRHGRLDHRVQHRPARPGQLGHPPRGNVTGAPDHDATTPTSVTSGTARRTVCCKASPIRSATSPRSTTTPSAGATGMVDPNGNVSADPAPTPGSTCTTRRTASVRQGARPDRGASRLVTESRYDGGRQPDRPDRCERAVHEVSLRRARQPERGLGEPVGVDDGERGHA